MSTINQQSISNQISHHLKQSNNLTCLMVCLDNSFPIRMKIFPKYQQLIKSNIDLQLIQLNVFIKQNYQLLHNLRYNGFELFKQFINKLINYQVLTIKVNHRVNCKYYNILLLLFINRFSFSLINGS